MRLCRRSYTTRWDTIVFREEYPSEGAAIDASDDLRNACGNLVDLMLAERLGTFARPLGGGTPTPMPPGLWEIDDPSFRFATSAFDPLRPFDPAAEPTHWIFVDERDLAEIIHVMCGGAPTRSVGGPPDEGSTDRVMAAFGGGGDGLLRLAVVEELTGMSRSTIYAKASRGEFTEPLRLGSRFSRWRRGEVESWLAALR